MKEISKNQLKDSQGGSIETCIRTARREDARALIGLFRHVGQETPYLNFTAEGIRLTEQEEADLIESYHQAMNSIYIVAEVDEQIVGMVNVRAYHGEKEDHVAEMGIAIIKDYWHYGIGSILTEEAIRFSESAKLKVLTVEVVTENLPAIKLYTKFGFTKVGRLSKRFRNGCIYHDTFVMEKLL